MKTTTISQVKVGDRITDGKKSQYGQYVNCVIDSIRITKGGRYVITISQTYINPEGAEQVRQTNFPYSNGALSGTTPITLY